MSSLLSRRQFALGGSAIASAAALRGRPLELRADPAAGKKAIVLVYLSGGQNQIFSSADSNLGMGTFGVTSSNIRDVGGGVFIDSEFAAGIGAEACARLSTFGTAHGHSGHEGGEAAFWANGAAAKLAHEMGGNGALRLVRVGPNAPSVPIYPHGSASMEAISDMAPMLAAVAELGASEPDRATTAALVQLQAEAYRAYAASNPVAAPALVGNVETLRKVLSLPAGDTAALTGIPSAYGLQGTTVRTLRDQFAAAEMSIRLGANVVILYDDALAWDSHSDLDGAGARRRMRERVTPGLRTFLDRTLLDPSLDVTVALVSEFNRSLPGSDHATILSAPLIGRSLARGTTGRLLDDARTLLPAGAPNHLGMWSLLAELGGAASNPFGPNPHKLLVG